MKKATIITLLTLSAFMVRAQSNSNHIITRDREYYILKFSIAHDTSILKPVDTSYSANNGVALQIINYSFQKGKKEMRLTVTNFYNGQRWEFKGCDINPYYPAVTAGVLSSPYNFQNAPYIRQN